MGLVSWLVVVLVIHQCVVDTEAANKQPDFKEEPYKVWLVRDAYETGGQQTVYSSVSVRDPDTDGKDGVVTLSVADSTVPFTFDNTDIKLTNSISSLTSPYRVRILATDGGSPPLTDTSTLTVYIRERPYFTAPATNGAAEVTELQTTPGQIITTLAATDPDSSKLTYSIKTMNPSEANLFRISGRNLVVGSGEFDYEKTKTYVLEFGVTDGAYNNTSNPFTVNVLDINDNSPVFGSPSYTKTISEKHTIDSSVVTVSATDVEAKANAVALEYSITSGNEAGLFSIEKTSGNIMLKKAPTEAEYTLVVTASDKGSPVKTTDVNVVITIDDDKDECSVYPCGLASTCTSGINFYKCDCAPGWTGTHCENSIDDCISGPCVNGGNCTDAHLSFTCNCTSGWTGPTCNTPCANHTFGPNCASDCVCNRTRVHPSKVDTQMCDINSGTCYCNSAYIGDSCELDVNECEVNKGLCTDVENQECSNIDGGYECVCTSGYTKKTNGSCVLDDPCAGITCSVFQECYVANGAGFCRDTDGDNTDLILGLVLGLLCLILLGVIIAAILMYMKNASNVPKGNRDYGYDNYY